ncbi:hypothetical protein KX928_09045 [Roseobacter sp. YSTF-M11]|uniref:Uncharacterized protein n=1 Tax=Roseobacter insulae TaxID=2859783 RepID=A0A9X1FUG3_9RHOB|nr:hypothetical protein [Roseobacter insulae]MBW4707931.1 hypothetical protein [Roseobacter insulae]
MIDKEEIHQGGFFKLMRVLDRRQRPFDRVEIMLPPTDVDLQSLHAETVPAPEIDYHDTPRYSAERKWVELQALFEGQSALHMVHAVLIAVLRRRDPPQAAREVFFRIWAEQGELMARELPTRWLISAATTFADVGETGDQRALGMGLSTLFDLIKLHDSERRITGQPGDVPFDVKRKIKRSPMAFDMQPYSLKGGDLDRVLLARLWQLSERDATIRPLATRMLRMAMTDQRSIFARVQKFKPEKDA